MPMSIGWLSGREGQVISVVSWGDLVSQDILQLGREIVVLLDAATVDRVHILVNESQVQNTQIKLVELRELTSLKHPRVGWILSWGAQQNRVVSFMQTLLMQIAGLRWWRFETEAEAEAYLAALLLPPS